VLGREAEQERAATATVIGARHEPPRAARMAPA